MLEDDEIMVRPSIMAFAVAMERVMDAHHAERGDSYLSMTDGDFFNALLTMHKRAVHIDEAMESDGTRAHIPNLAARIGCYAMFFHYHFSKDRQSSEETDARTTD